MKKDEKISGKITELVQKEYENEEMRLGKSTAPVTGQSVGQTGNAEGVLPSTATETVDDIVLPAAVETAGMAETIDEKATFWQIGAQETGEYAGGLAVLFDCTV